MPKWIPHFRIPDFALGALCIAILGTTAVFYAFPDTGGSWLWWALIASGVLLWALGSGVLDQNSKTIADDQKSPSDGDDGKNNIDEGVISFDTAALIKAINEQGRANRKQEKTEEDAKALREKVTMLIIVATAGLILAQVIEMRRAYDPIRDQAEYIKKTFVASERARIGIISSSAENFTKGQWTFAQIMYSNGGHEAAPVDMVLDIYAFTDVDWDGGIIAAK